MQDIGSTRIAEGYSPKTFWLNSLVSCKPHHRHNKLFLLTPFQDVMTVEAEALDR